MIVSLWWLESWSTHLSSTSSSKCGGWLSHDPGCVPQHLHSRSVGISLQLWQVLQLAASAGHWRGASSMLCRYIKSRSYAGSKSIILSMKAWDLNMPCLWSDPTRKIRHGAQSPAFLDTEPPQPIRFLLLHAGAIHPPALVPLPPCHKNKRFTGTILNEWSRSRPNYNTILSGDTKLKNCSEGCRTTDGCFVTRMYYSIFVSLVFRSHIFLMKKKSY